MHHCSLDVSLSFIIYYHIYNTYRYNRGYIGIQSWTSLWYLTTYDIWMTSGPLVASNLPSFPPTKDILRSLRHPNIICPLAAAEFLQQSNCLGWVQFQWDAHNVRPPFDSVQLVNISPISLWFMVFITIVTGANLNQFITRGPHIVHIIYTIW